MTFPSDSFRSIDAATGLAFGESYPVHGQAEVEAVCAAAADAVDPYRALSLEARGRFLDQIATEIDAIGEPLIAIAHRESGLPVARLEGERERTVGQLRMFASVVRDGAFLGLRIDPALPDRTPAPRPDLRLRKIPIGPVAVFGASNFPLAFSTAGGDAASALAAGCPVVIKGHPAHPGTGALVAEAMLKAAQACSLPDGVVGHLTGPGNALGAALVKDPRIMAVAFTGSRAGGRALMALAQARPVPVPVYAEMSSINPVLLMPAALQARGAELGAAFVQSLVMGSGQFCTNPGLVLALEGPGLDSFLSAAADALGRAAGSVMLTPSIHAAYQHGVERLTGHADIVTVARGAPGQAPTCGAGALFRTTADAFMRDPALSEEVFGAASLVVGCRDEAQMAALIEQLEGQLTATLQMDDSDVELARRLLPVLERKAGRILANGWPTGVEVTHAMVHGGPFPATSDPRTTSVGSLAIDRFLRPVAYQNLPAALLPAELADDQATRFSRLIDGAITLGSRA